MAWPDEGPSSKDGDQFWGQQRLVPHQYAEGLRASGDEAGARAAWAGRLHLLEQHRRMAGTNIMGGSQMDRHGTYRRVAH